MMARDSAPRVIAAGIVLVAVIAACSGTASPTGSAEASSAEASSAGSAAASPSAGGGEATAVAVTLQEWAVVPDTTTIAAGETTFQVINGGPEDVHEFVVLQTDLAPDALPTDATGAVDETAAGIVVVTEIEDIPVGVTMETTAPLEAGAYVLLCNIYDATENEAHYQMGMRTAFTVTG